MEASLAAALNDSNVRAGIPKGTSVESMNLYEGLIREDNTVDAAPDTTLCPLGYSGNGGVCNNGRQSLLI